MTMINLIKKIFNKSKSDKPKMWSGEVWSEGFHGIAVRYYKKEFYTLDEARNWAKRKAFWADHLGIIARPLGIIWIAVDLSKYKDGREQYWSKRK